MDTRLQDGTHLTERENVGTLCRMRGDEEKSPHPPQYPSTGGDSGLNNRDRSPAANGGCRERAAGRHPQCGSPSAHAGPTTRRGRPRRRPLAAAFAASRLVAAAVPREGRAAAVGGRRSAQPPRASLTRGPEWPRCLTTGKEDSKQCHREMKKATTKIQAAPHLVEMRIYNQRTRGGQ